MNDAQKYLAQANRQIAELAVQIATQRVIVKHALDTSQRSEMAESLLNSRSTGYFCSVATDHPAPCRVTLRRAGACHDATGMDETITLGAIDDGPYFLAIESPTAHSQGIFAPRIPHHRLRL
jgi:hypothetical protein